MLLRSTAFMSRHWLAQARAAQGRYFASCALSSTRPVSRFCVEYTGYHPCAVAPRKARDLVAVNERMLHIENVPQLLRLRAATHILKTTNISERS